MELAEKFPDIPFYIMGNIDSKPYYQEILDLKRVKKIDNAHIMPNVPKDMVNNKLSGSKFFISSTPNEHFGLSTVEAIASGCIPLGHNSGGQIEILMDEDLLYNDIHCEEGSDLVSKFQHLLSLNNEELRNKRYKLQENIKKFDEKNFKEKLIAYLPN